MGEKGLRYVDVDPGNEIPPLVKHVSLVKNVMYAAATWDLHRVHYDAGYAKSKGFPGPFMDGQMLGAFLAQMVTQWGGPASTLKKLGLSYRVMALPGDTLSCRGTVERKFIEDGENLVSCALWIENQRGEKVASPAHALIALPS